MRTTRNEYTGKKNQKKAFWALFCPGMLYIYVLGLNACANTAHTDGDDNITHYAVADTQFFLSYLWTIIKQWAWTWKPFHVSAEFGWMEMKRTNERKMKKILSKKKNTHIKSFLTSLPSSFFNLFWIDSVGVRGADVPYLSRLAFVSRPRKYSTYLSSFSESLHCAHHRRRCRR